jgi:nucleotide-binding universal stress UspA family protein
MMIYNPFPLREVHMLNFKNILYTFDLDSKNISTLKEALEFAQIFHCPVHILYVNDPQAGYRFPTDREDAVALKVKETVPESLLENMNIIYAISKGNVAEEVVKYAREHMVDLIIVGHKHMSKIYTSMFDSIDVNIIDTALIPVLVIPKK